MTSTGERAGQKAREALWSKAATVDPAALVECRGVADVQNAVRIARDHGVPVSVLGGGHDWAGRAICSGGVVLDGTVAKLGVQAAMAAGGCGSLAAWKRCPKPVPSVPL